MGRSTPGSPARSASPSVSSSWRLRPGLGWFFGHVSTLRLGGCRTCPVLAEDAGGFGTQPFASSRPAGGYEASAGSSEAWPRVQRRWRVAYLRWPCPRSGPTASSLPPQCLPTRITIGCGNPAEVTQYPGQRTEGPAWAGWRVTNSEAAGSPSWSSNL